MKISDRLKKINSNIDRFADGKKFHYYPLILAEEYIFKIPSTFFFAYEFQSKNYLERRKYVSNNDLKKLEAMNPKDNTLLISKYEFDKHFSEYLGRDYLFVHDSTFEEFCGFVKKHPTFMVKMNWACEGTGIEKCTVTDNKDLKKLYDSFFNDYILIEEVLRQHAKMNLLNSSSVNTIRVSTISHNSKVYIIAASLRIGVGGVTDNLHGGGICCSVDIETGIVKSLGYDGKMNKYLKHPTTGTIIPGFQIPNWDKALETVTKCAERIPQFKWVGWDVAITDDGAAVIEGNHNQGVDLVQIGNKGLKPDIKAILKQ